MLESEACAPHRVGRTQSVIDGRGVERTAGRKLLIRERDAESTRVVLAHLLVRVAEVGPVAVAGDVHAPDVEAGVAVGHPVGQRQADTPALRQPGHDATRHPVVAQAANGAHERVAVGRERERPVDDVLDAGRGQRRVVLERDLELRSDAVEVGFKQLGPEVPRRLLRRPRLACLFVCAHKDATVLLADVDLAGEVHADRHLLARRSFVIRNLLHVLGDEVHVLHRQHRQLEADHAAHLASPQPARVHDVLGVDVALIGDHVPGAVDVLREVVHPRVAVDLRTGHAGALGVRVGDARRVDVALDRVVEDADEVLRVEDREHLLRLFERDHLQVHAEVATPGLRHLQPVEAGLVVGQHEAAGEVDAAILPGLRLDLLVEVDRVLLELRHVRVTVERVHPPGRMPGRTRRELTPLDEHHIRPTGLREVVEHAGADHSPTDHNYARR